MAEPKVMTIDPEVEEILSRIASDPKSLLLRASRPRKIAAFIDASIPSKSPFPGITTAEQHLIISRRHDVAWLLRAACRTKLINPPGGPFDVSPFRSAREPHTSLTAEELTSRSTSQRLNDSIDKGLKVYWQLIDQCVGELHGSRPTVVQLAEASLRLESTDEARIMAALDMIRSGAPDTGIQILTHVLAAPTSAAVAVSARGNLGMAYSFLGKPSSALAHYSAACGLGVECLEQSMNRLLFGLQLGQVEEVREAIAMIEALGSDALGPAECFARSRLTLRERGNWSPSIESRSTIRDIDSTLGPASRRIASVFASS